MQPPFGAFTRNFRLIRLRKFRGQQPAGPAVDGETRVVLAICLMSLNGHLLRPGGTSPPCFSFKGFNVGQCLLKMTSTVQLPGRFYKPCVLQGFLILFTEEKLKTRMDFACVLREPRTSPARLLFRVEVFSTRRSRVITHNTGICCSCTSKIDLIHSTQHENISRDKRGICFIHVWLKLDMTTCNMLEWMKIWIESVVRKRQPNL